MKRRRENTENLGEVLALYNRGIHLIFTDIDKIRTIMEQELCISDVLIHDGRFLNVLKLCFHWGEVNI